MELNVGTLPYVTEVRAHRQNVLSHVSIIAVRLFAHSAQTINGGHGTSSTVVAVVVRRRLRRNLLPLCQRKTP